MLGFLAGALGAVGIVFVLRRARRHRRGRRRWMMRRVFERLDTTLGQEKVIAQALEEVEHAAWAFRHEAREARVDLGRAMRGERFDTASVRAMYARQDALLEAMRKSVLEGMQKVHEALTPSQRAVAAELVEWRGHRASCG